MYRRSFLGSTIASFLTIPYLKAIGAYRKTICFGRDNSGSISQNMLNRIVQQTEFTERGHPDQNFLYFLHDSECEEVNREKFVSKRHGGGTLISTFFQELQKTLPYMSEAQVVYFSDGDNWGRDHEDVVSNVKELFDQKQIRHLIIYEMAFEFGAPNDEWIERLQEETPQQNLTIYKENDNEGTHLFGGHGRNLVRSRSTTSLRHVANRFSRRDCQTQT